MYGIAARSRAAALLAGVVAAATLLFGTGLGSAVAVERAPANHTVLKNQYGRVGSHITGTFGKHGTVTGSFRPNRFKVNKFGKLVAIGRLTATMKRGNGSVVGTAHKRIRIPVRTANGSPVARTAAGTAARAATCDILHLVLGPLDLNLLGLMVHLDKVVLNITAATGAGNLLGNLLCAVTGLLDQGGLLPQVSQILNSILAILRI